MNVKRLRLSKDMTQKELAERLGVERSTVAMWETNNIMPRFHMLSKLTDVFECSLSDLLEDRKAE